MRDIHSHLLAAECRGLYLTHCGQVPPPPAKTTYCAYTLVKIRNLNTSQQPCTYRPQESLKAVILNF